MVLSLYAFRSSRFLKREGLNSVKSIVLLQNEHFILFQKLGNVEVPVTNSLFNYYFKMANPDLYGISEQLKKKTRQIS